MAIKLQITLNGTSEHRVGKPDEKNGVGNNYCQPQPFFGEVPTRFCENGRWVIGGMDQANRIEVTKSHSANNDLSKLSVY
ncbi:MAG: hypothetical protein ACJAS7_000806 [Alpinimonas sp.]|jgi:hypothetical protein